MKYPAVKSCAVVGVPDSEEIFIPVANIVLNEECHTEQIKQEVIRFICDAIARELPEYSQMAGYNFLDELPITAIGKLDFKKLEEIGVISK